MSIGAAIVSDKQLGDVLLLQPCAEYLSEIKGAPTALFVREAFRPLVELMPGCVWGGDVKGRFQQVWTTSWSSQAVWQAFRLPTIQRLLIVNKPRHIRWWYRFLFHTIKLEPPTAEYWARYFWRVVSGRAVEDFVPPHLLRPPAEWTHAQQPNKGFILVNPTAAWERKFWGVRSWAETVAKVAQDYALPVVIAGGGSEREIVHCAAIAENCGVPVLNLAGETSLKEYLALLAAARLVLCIDGAASHLAQAFGVPTVTLFGPTHEGKWHWPTPQNQVLAARNFQDPPVFGPASGIPVKAMLEKVEAVFPK